MNDEQILAEVSPGIQYAVRRMRDWGYQTTDSGDGSNFEAGMECALEFPHVFAQLEDLNFAFTQANNLQYLLEKEFPGKDVTVEMSYSPIDKVCVLMAYGDIAVWPDADPV